MAFLPGQPGALLQDARHPGALHEPEKADQTGPATTADRLADGQRSPPRPTVPAGHKYLRWFQTE